MEHGAYFKTKPFAWVLNQTCELDRKYEKIKITKNARPVDL